MRLFLDGADISSEKWEPYVEWSDHLKARPSDRIVQKSAVGEGLKLTYVQISEFLRAGHCCPPQAQRRP
jgi:hypothetical protein